MDIVTTSADAGPGSLRDTMAGANPGDTITFAPGLGTITLTSGKLLIDKDLTISGPSGASQTISGGANVTQSRSPFGGGGGSRVFEVAAGISVTLSDLTITNGHAPDASGQQAAGDGGGILNNGTLTVRDSTIIHNKAGDGATEFDPTPGTAGGSGGGIANHGTLTVVGSTISGNTAGAGGPWISFSLPPFCSSCAGGDGGGGGGIVNTGALTVTNSTIVGNAGGAGGFAIEFNSFGTAARKSGAARHDAESGSTGAGGNGGGIANEGGVAVLVSNTITGNSSGQSMPSPSSLPLLARGGGVANEGGGTLTVGDTILAANAAVDGPDCAGAVTSRGYNLIQDASGCSFDGDSADDLTGQDPLLGPLQDNGGSTLTEAPWGGSPAIDAVPASSCGSATDQRGAARPDDSESACDSGAVETSGNPAPPPTSTGTATDTATPAPTDTPTNTATPTPCTGSGASYSYYPGRRRQPQPWLGRYIDRRIGRAGGPYQRRRHYLYHWRQRQPQHSGWARRPGAGRFLRARAHALVPHR